MGYLRNTFLLNLILHMISQRRGLLRNLSNNHISMVEIFCRKKLTATSQMFDRVHRLPLQHFYS